MEDVRRVVIALRWSIEVWQAEDDGLWYSRLLNENDIVAEYGPEHWATMALGKPMLDLVNGEFGYEAEVNANWEQWAGW